MRGEGDVRARERTAQTPQRWNRNEGVSQRSRAEDKNLGWG
jgi:hypothetical protein